MELLFIGRKMRAFFFYLRSGSADIVEANQDLCFGVAVRQYSRHAAIDYIAISDDDLNFGRLDARRFGEDQAIEGDMSGLEQAIAVAHL